MSVLVCFALLLCLWNENVTVEISIWRDSESAITWGQVLIVISPVSIPNHPRSRIQWNSDMCRLEF